MTPHGLTLLANLRRLGQSPELAVVVTDDWRYVELAEAIGALAVRVAGPKDHAHDWQCLSGLFVILILRNPQPSGLADFASALLAANPRRLETFVRDQLTLVWDGERKAA
jgi:hypothetical protein